MYEVPLAKLKNVPTVSGCSTLPAEPVTLPVTLPVKSAVIRLAAKLPVASLETIVLANPTGVASVCNCLVIEPL